VSRDVFEERCNSKAHLQLIIQRKVNIRKVRLKESSVVCYLEYHSNCYQICSITSPGWKIQSPTHQPKTRNGGQSGNPLEIN